jgi:predicted PhzF superfamily epimerase YddE/YHI9
MTVRSTVRIVQVDAFTAEPFRGNPAGVCVFEEWPPDEWMLAVAAEMNLSETAFLVRQGAGFQIRYFTPLVEVPLCGHATLASAHLLWEEGLVPMSQEIALSAQGGQLSASREGTWVCLDFPAIPAARAEIPAGLSEALGADILGAYPSWESGYLVELDGVETVRCLEPDFMRLRAFGPINVTAEGSVEARCDFVSRFFAPSLGIDEDPVTGVAHCSLAPFWAERLGKSELLGFQLSRRGGVVKVRARGERVSILGQAVSVMWGEMIGW